MRIGEKIKQLVDDTDSRTDDVAKRLGMSVQNLYKIYKKDSCESKYLETLMEMFDVDSHFFFEGRGTSSTEGLSYVHEEGNEYGFKDKYLELLEKYTALLEGKK